MRGVTTVDTRGLFRAFYRWAACKELLDLTHVVCVLVLWVVMAGSKKGVVHGWILMASYHLIVSELSLIQFVC